MNGHLVVSVGGDTHHLTGDRAVVIGRGKDCDIQIRDALVSRHHLRLTPVDGRWRGDDLSLNGTFRGTVAVGPAFELLDTDRLRLGAPDSPVEILLVRAVAPAPPTLDPLSTSRSDPPPPDAAAPVRYMAIGRDSTCQIRIDDLMVSRRHARVTTTATGPVLEDLGSSNGTYLNGRAIEGRTPVADGDLIGVGNTVLTWRDGRLVTERRTARVLAAIDATVRTSHGKVLLDGVSLAVDAGELVAVAGPSGAGKSTMIGVLTGTRTPDEGAVLVDGWDLSQHRSALHDQIGYVPQDDVVHRALTVEQVLDFAARLRLAADVTADERRARISEVLASLGLQPNAGQRVSTLSGGQRKRVNIALELLARPQLLVLDEPTSGLDPGTDHSLMQLLRDLARQGQAVIVVTHSLGAIEACDRVVFIRVGGRLAYDGPPSDAPRAFGRNDLVGVYDDLNIAGPPDARQQARLRGTVQRSGAPSATPVRTSAQQLRILTSRYLACLAADRRNLLILLAQAPILGLLTRTLVEQDGLTAGPAGNPTVSRVLLTLVMSITWLGGSNGIREIVKEQAIYQRERGTGVTVPAYLGSKVLVLGAITVVQALVLNTVALAGKPMPSSGAFLPNATVELLVDVALAGIGSLALALLVSAVTSNADKAMTALPILLVPQLILSGGLIDLAGRTVLEVLSPLATARWGYSAAASTVDIEALLSPAAPAAGSTALSAQAPGIDKWWASNPGTWWFDIGMLMLLTAVFLAVAAYGLKSRDPKAN